jgi:hypothetical protein
MSPGKRRTRWLPCFRIIPSRFPPVGWFDRIAGPGDLDALLALEARTNPLVREEAGDLHLVPDEERICGPGTQLIMTAFTHLNPDGGRFSDGSFGAYYAGESLDTAILETVHGHGQWLAEAHLGPRDLEMQVILADLDGDLWDVRGPGFEHLHDPDPATYGAGQALARKARAERVDGILYRSVRRPGGECAAVLRPTALAKAHSAQHLIYPWDGQRIDRSRICVKTLLP